MTTAIRHAWLQKHGSPEASRGEFHWYPPDGDRELRSSLVERSRGIDPPAVLWELAPDRVSWAQAFAATAPTDGRRYVGLVLTIVEDGAATTSQLLDALEPPPAAPWAEHQPARAASRARRWAVRGRALVDEASWSEATPTERHGAIASGHRARAGDDAAVRRSIAAVRAKLEPRAPHGDDSTVVAADRPGADELMRVARTLLAGGAAIVADPTHRALPRWFAVLERWMPADVRARPRSGGLRAGTAVTAVTADPVAALVVAAWREPASRDAQAWTLLAELATARDRTVDEVYAEVGRSEWSAAGLRDAERAAIGEPRDLTGTLHAWGRGRLDRIAGADTLPDRLADAVALRVLACLLAGRDPSYVIAATRWHALLPAARRSVLLDTVARRAASLRALVEGDHA